jgi:hypothetical protein
MWITHIPQPKMNHMETVWACHLGEEVKLQTRGEHIEVGMESKPASATSELRTALKLQPVDKDVIREQCRSEIIFHGCSFNPSILRSRSLAYQLWATVSPSLRSSTV